MSVSAETHLSWHEARAAELRRTAATRRLRAHAEATRTRSRARRGWWRVT